MIDIRTRPVVLGCCAVAAVCSAVRAQQVCDYRSVSSAVWSQHTTWNCWNGNSFVGCDDSFFIGEDCYATPPGTGDTATIAEQTTVHIEGTSESIGDLTIDDHSTTAAVLELRSASSSSSLTIENDLSMHTGGNPGKIVFEDGASTDNEGELIIDSDRNAAGVIETSATSAGGKITVTGTNTLTISGDLNVSDGPLTVSGSVLVANTGEVTVSGGNLTFQDEFENDGDFTMSGSTTLTVEFQGGIAALSTGAWDINNSNATFKLVTTDTNITATGGDMLFRAGTIDADASFQFGGTMTWSGTDSVIEVAANKVFHATSDGA